MGRTARETPDRGQLDDGELVTLLQQGDRVAFAELFRRYQGRIFGLCLKLTGNRTEAQDLCQDAFVKLYEKIGSCSEPGSFASWFRRLASRLAIDRIRRERRLVFPDPDEEGADFASALAEPRAQRPASRLALEGAMGQLAEGYRVVFLLHDALGYTHEEIGELCGFSANNSKSQLSRARRRLRDLLRPQAPTSETASETPKRDDP